MLRCRADFSATLRDPQQPKEPSVFSGQLRQAALPSAIYFVEDSQRPFPNLDDLAAALGVRSHSTAESLLIPRVTVSIVGITILQFANGVVLMLPRPTTARHGRQKLHERLFGVQLV